MRFNGNRKKFLANCLILSHNIISTDVGLVCMEVEEIQLHVPSADQAFWRVWFMIRNMYNNVLQLCFFKVLF